MSRSPDGAFSLGRSAPDVLSNEHNGCKRSNLPSWRTVLAVLILLSASALLMTGCGSVMVTDQTPPPPAGQVPPNVTDVPNTQETHDLAVSAVDFDPALDVQQILSGRPYALLVAVENKGNRSEGTFTVTARLTNLARTQVLASDRKTVTLLTPGDITVVRFPRESAPPLQRAYILDAQVQAVPREVNLGNNQKVLEIDVSSGN